MAKTFYTSGTGSQQTLTPSQNEKVAIYDTIADAEADLANLEEGQIVATPDTGDELAQPVDVVESGNMHAVTSNAVANSNAMPVNEVTANNLHSVTSGAVAQKFNDYAQTKVLNEWHILCRHGQRTYIHRDVNTSGDNPKWIKLIIYFHSAYNTGTAVAEYLVRLNYTPYGGTGYRGLTYKLIAGIEANNTDYDVLANQSGSLGWDSDGIYITNNSSFADFSTTVISLYDRVA